jgi:hypothetical protein
MRQPKLTRLIIYFFSIHLGLQVSACASKPDVGSKSDDLADLNIDPDQKALPAGESTNAPDKDVEWQTPRVDQKMTRPANEASTVVPPTPTVDELRSNTDGEATESVEPEAPIYQESGPSGAEQGDVGSGSQTRFIKAAELNIREQPNRHSKIVGKLRGGQRVRVQIKGGWARLEPNRWIRSRWLTKNQPKDYVTSDDSSNKSKVSRTKKKSAVGKSRVKKSAKNKRKSR